MFTCQDCIHCKDGKCEFGFELVESYEDAYDCTRFYDRFDQ